MFAFALWDEATATLFLARDRLGIKPLYYVLLPDQIVFGSELRSLLPHSGVERTVDLRALSRYLLHEYVPAPDSILKTVRKLPAGHWLSFTHGRVKVEPYWEFSFRRNEDCSPEEHAAHLKAAIEESVKGHLVSDVPLGVFLSGGIDSGAIAAFAARHVTGRLQTFSIGFEDPSFDESRYARQVARHIGSDHHEEIFDARVLLEMVSKLPDLLDEPLGDASFIPTCLLSGFTRRSVTVALAGDGGDELFAGYPTYQAHRLASAYMRLPRATREGIIRPLVERLPVSFDDLSFDFRLKRFVGGIELPTAQRHLTWLGSFTPATQRELLTADVLAELGSWEPFDEISSALAHSGAASDIEEALVLDLKGYLGEGILTKTDRASMAVSLEVRVPFLDRRVVELAAGIPTDLKLRGLTTKSILTRSLRGILPDKIIDRKKKGFGIPIARWFCLELAPMLEEVLSPDALRRRGLFRPEAVRRLIDDHRARRRDNRKQLYTLLAFELWASKVLGSA
jgi:asparagine synthase (glutamine-hydrolysing)